MASNWFYSKQGKQLGPVSSGQLKEMARHGQLLATDMIWKEGMASWVQAGSLPDLFPQGGSYRPEVPPQPPAFSAGPPNFPVTPTQKSKLPWILGGVAALGLVCCGLPVACLSAIGNKQNKEFQAQAVKLGIGDTADSNKVESAAIRVTSNQLHSEYHANEVTADDKYKDKQVGVTGTVTGIRKTAFGSIVIDLQTANRFQSVNCYFDDDHKAEAAKVSKGQSVTVRGTCKGMSLGTVSVKDCEFVK